MWAALVVVAVIGAVLAGMAVVKRLSRRHHRPRTRLHQRGVPPHQQTYSHRSGGAAGGGGRKRNSYR